MNNGHGMKVKCLHMHGVRRLYATRPTDGSGLAETERLT